ncbi:MAG: molybdopterin-guanine dinucleotide biosynthesis protein B [candidate division WOR-3 bacterium]
MKVIEISGKSGSGKTLLIEHLIKGLSSAGYRVGAIKKSFHHNVEYDKEGKDTFRMEQAGASITGGFSRNSAFLYYKHSVNPVEFIKKFQAVDFLLIEGNMGVAVPKIYCVSDEEPPRDDKLVFAFFTLKEDTPMGLTKPIFSLSRIEELTNLLMEKTPEFLPQLNCGKCGYDCAELLRRILIGDSSIQECQVLFGTKCDVTIDGEKMVLMPFLDKMLENIVKGFLSPLKGFRKGKIKIEINE